MRDPLVVVEATGSTVLQVLENAVSKYPSLEGRFPQVSDTVPLSNSNINNEYIFIS